MRRTNAFARVLLTTLCSLALAWICMNVGAITAEAETATSVEIIGDNFSEGAVIMDFEKSSNFFSFSGKATLQDGTLTLENVTISCDTRKIIYPAPGANVYGIRADGDLTIKLIGNNRIEGYPISAILVAGGSLTFTGPGSLTMSQSRLNYAIQADSITIRDGATLENTSGRAPIYSTGGTLLIDNATLISNGRSQGFDAREIVAKGDVVVRAGYSEGEAVEVQDAVDPTTGVVDSSAWVKWYVYIQSTVKQETVAESKGSAPAPGEPCNHDYVWETYKAATATTDGIMRYRCKYCGEVEYSVPTAAYYVFNKETQEAIQKAAQGATVTVSTPVFISFHEMVKDALVARPDVSLVVHYKNAGRSYVMSIPAGSGDQLTTLFGDSQYAGFLYLGGAFATVEK